MSMHNGSMDTCRQFECSSFPNPFLSSYYYLFGCNSLKSKSVLFQKMSKCQLTNTRNEFTSFLSMCVSSSNRKQVSCIRLTLRVNLIFSFFTCCRLFRAYKAYWRLCITCCELPLQTKTGVLTVYLGL